MLIEYTLIIATIALSITLPLVPFLFPNSVPFSFILCFFFFLKSRFQYERKGDICLSESGFFT